MCRRTRCPHGSAPSSVASTWLPRRLSSLAPVPGQHTNRAVFSLPCASQPQGVHPGLALGLRAALSPVGRYTPSRGGHGTTMMQLVPLPPNLSSSLALGPPCSTTHRPISLLPHWMTGALDDKTGHHMQHSLARLPTKDMGSPRGIAAFWLRLPAAHVAKLEPLRESRGPASSPTSYAHPSSQCWNASESSSQYPPLCFNSSLRFNPLLQEVLHDLPGPARWSWNRSISPRPCTARAQGGPEPGHLTGSQFSSQS